MFRKILAAGAVLISGFAVASPAAAAEYPAPSDTQIIIKLSADTLVGGTDLTIKVIGRSGEDVPPGTMTITAFGKTYTKSHNPFEITVTTPVVQSEEDFVIRAHFVPNDLTSAASSASTSASSVTAALYVVDSASAAPTAYRPASASTTVTLLPVGATIDDGADTGSNDANGILGLLPDTGGTAFWILILGGALVIVGGGTVVATRRRTNKPV